MVIASDLCGDFLCVCGHDQKQMHERPTTSRGSWGQDQDFTQVLATPITRRGRNLHNIEDFRPEIGRAWFARRQSAERLRVGRRWRGPERFVILRPESMRQHLEITKRDTIANCRSRGAGFLKLITDTELQVCE